MRPQSIMLSLTEPCQFLVTAFREYAAILIQQNNPKVGNYQQALNYNFVPYMQQLLNEIFGDGAHNVPLGKLKSTQILIKDGLDSRYAEQVATTTFRTTIAAICTILPDITFGPNHGYTFDLVEPMDLWVNLPQPVPVEEIEEY